MQIFSDAPSSGPDADYPSQISVTKHLGDFLELVEENLKVYSEGKRIVNLDYPVEDCGRMLHHVINL